MISHLDPFVINNGVLKENFRDAGVSRAVFHRTAPVSAASATTKGLEAPSQLKNRRSSTRMGEPPLPWTGGYFRDVCFHRVLPSRSRQAVPKCPKCAKILFSMTTGVGLA